MYLLENDYLSITIDPKGAELQRLYNKKTNIEHLWNGNAAYWGKYSPILFPIVGTLKNNEYYFNDEMYQLPRHGFARDKMFEINEISSTEISFSLEHDENSLLVYPFQFKLTVNYNLNQNKLSCNYEVVNRGNDEMYFSIGAHPAFAVPYVPNTQYEDYTLTFNNDESLTRWKLTNEGLIGDVTESIHLENKQLQLNHQLFESDAIVMKDMKSNLLTLSTIKSKHGFNFRFTNAPFFGIWAAPNAPFVCLEPWSGIADPSGHHQQFTQKEGIHQLMASQKYKSSWEVECF